ncbi:uncharacterized protein LOC101859485 [Aplysia californica]|uniref:Uncharacterized protein LOC101859485 n=1 Tax=Aplysia californica TaxID=6500 RepID=A0ABM0JR25_APLCA|nr:uncharacterized protein LOC101859485 [Aplysia californica]
MGMLGCFRSIQIKVYKAVVLSSLLYGSETWTLYSKHIDKLEQFHQRALHGILGIRRQDRITNIEVLNRSSSHTLSHLLHSSILTALSQATKYVRPVSKLPAREVLSEPKSSMDCGGYTLLRFRQETN